MGWASATSICTRLNEYKLTPESNHDFGICILYVPVTGLVVFCAIRYFYASVLILVGNAGHVCPSVRLIWASNSKTQRHTNKNKVKRSPEQMEPVCVFLARKFQYHSHPASKKFPINNANLKSIIVYS